MRRAAVGYCDVTGFMSWIERSAVSHRDVTEFIQKMKACFRNFRERTGYFCIPIGDGIISVLAASHDTERLQVYPVITALYALSLEVSVLADQQPNPRPGRSRIRIAEGVVYRTEEPPMLGVTDSPIIDYIGEPLNLGSRLLQVRRELPSLITESAVEAMTPEEREKLIIEPAGITGHLPRGVKFEDMRGLCQFRPKAQISGS